MKRVWRLVRAFLHDRFLSGYVCRNFVADENSTWGIYCYVCKYDADLHEEKRRGSANRDTRRYWSRWRRLYRWAKSL